MITERTETSLVAIVIDATPAKKFASQALDGSTMMNRIFDAVIGFGNAHLMQGSHNKLAVIACNSKSTYVCIMFVTMTHNHICSLQEISVPL